MEVFRTKAELQAALQGEKNIGFVPTMGALHQGHISLIKRAVSEAKVIVCSIFVNPIQFNNKEDLEKYPRDEENDLQLLKKAGCNMVFIPSEQEMYPEEVTENYQFGALEQVMEGAFRPGHFNGVAVVVKRLFDIVKPQKAFFGEKDFQQLAIICQLVKQENIQVEIVPCPIVREEDGLAMSSRNMRLSLEDRAQAPFIYQMLQMAKQYSAIKKAEEVRKIITKQFENNPHFKLEYFEIVDAETLQPVSFFEEHESVVACVATWLGGVRLIDVLRLK